MNLQFKNAGQQAGRSTVASKNPTFRLNQKLKGYLNRVLTQVVDTMRKRNTQVAEDTLTAYPILLDYIETNNIKGMYNVAYVISVITGLSVGRSREVWRKLQELGLMPSKPWKIEYSQGYRNEVYYVGFFRNAALTPENTPELRNMLLKRDTEAEIMMSAVVLKKQGKFMQVFSNLLDKYMDVDPNRVIELRGNLTSVFA